MPCGDALGMIVCRPVFHSAIFHFVIERTRDAGRLALGYRLAPEDRAGSRSPATPKGSYDFVGGLQRFAAMVPALSAPATDRNPGPARFLRPQSIAAWCARYAAGYRRSARAGEIRNLINGCRRGCGGSCTLPGIRRAGVGGDAAFLCLVGGHAAVSGLWKNHSSFHLMPCSEAAMRIACMSSSDGATPFSQRETLACVTPANAANSAWVAPKTSFRMYRIAFIVRILCANG